MSAAKISTSFGLTVIAELDEPMRLVTLTGVFAATHVRITVRDDASGDDGAMRVTAYASGFGYRRDGSIGRMARKGICELDALPRWLVQAAERAYRHELARLSVVAAFPADSPIEAARRRHTDSEP